MTASLDEPASAPADADSQPAAPQGRTRPSPPPTAATWHFGVAAVAWAVYLTSLLALYVIAITRHASAGQDAAAWGMSASVAAALITLPLAARPGRPGPRVRTSMLVVVGGLLTLASIALIWVSVNLTLAKDATGAWVLAVVATAAPATSLLRLFGDSPGIPAPEKTPMPHTIRLEVVVRPGDLAEYADRSAPRAATATVTLPPPPPPPPPPPLRYDGLLSRDWELQLGTSPPKVALDAGFWGELTAKLGQRPTEVGGVALTVRSAGTMVIFGAVFPEQLVSTGGSCEFPAAEVDRVREVIDTVTGDLGIDATGLTVAWVHTHPGLGVFLSGTDEDTSADWRALDPDFTPIVLDPLKTKLHDQIGVFDSRNQRIRSLKLVSGMVNAAASAQLKHELLTVYRDAGLGKTMVLMPGLDR